MTGEDRMKIVSEDYADLILDYRNNPKRLEESEDSFIHIINETYAEVFIPVEEFTQQSIFLFGYSAIPNLFGLTSQASLEASGVYELRRMPNFNLRGEGVLIGIVDTGINYVSPAFLKADGTTKIMSIWDQTIQSEGGSPFATGYGTEYLAEQINQALVNENPLQIVPSMDENGHGSMLAAIAAGTESSENGFFGVAPDSEIVVVKLKPAKEYLKRYLSVPEDVLCYQENDIMWGVQYCFQVSRQVRKPIVICIGIGTSQDSHDGRSPLSIMVSSLGDFPRVGIVTSAGNEGNLGRHYRGVINPSIGDTTVELNVGENDSGFTIQLWGDSPKIYSIDITSPSGEYIPRIAVSLRVAREISFIFEETIIYIDYQIVESETGDQLILLRFFNTAAGIWRFKVYGQGDLVGGFNMWLPMGDMITEDTYFIEPDIYTTVLSPGAAMIPITVTAYNAVTGTLFVHASRGYSRSNNIKPDLAAPGVNYIAPNLNGEYVTFTGTGVATAHMAGIVALVLEWGIVQGNQPTLDTVEIKKILIRGAKRSKNLIYPNRDWGYGIVDIYNVYNVLREV